MVTSNPSSELQHRERERELERKKMGIMAKSKSSTENWGMGLLLVFFPEDTTTIPLSSSSSSSSSSAPSLLSSSSNPSSSRTIIKRTNSKNQIITRTQSTISICALLLFLTLLLFTLSTFEPTIPNHATTINNITKTPRRFLPQKPQNKLIKTTKTGNYLSWFTRTVFWPKHNEISDKSSRSNSFALQGMGKLYRRGTRSMSDLVVAHVLEDTDEAEFRLFLRLLHRSGVTARADVVFIFANSSLCASKFEASIQEENASFLKLVDYYRELGRKSHDSVWVPSFDVTQFVKSGNNEMGEPNLWGDRRRNIRPAHNNNFNESGDSEGESTRLRYGSVVGFEANELDPENSLAGFLGHVPVRLRRWACYPMLLGRVRRNFKHVMLVEVKNLLLIGDPLDRFRNRRPESVYITTKQESASKHSRRNSEKTQHHSQVNSAILMGGTRGIRRFSNAMLTDIARVAMQQQQKKRKSSFTESGILSQLVGNGHILKNIDLMTSTESIPTGMSSLTGSNSFLWNNGNHSIIIQRGNSNHDLNSIILKQICSCEVESSVYNDC